MKKAAIQFISLLPRRQARRVTFILSRVFQVFGSNNVKMLCTWNYSDTQKVKLVFNAQFAVMQRSYAYGQENILLRNSINLQKNKTDIIILDVGANFGYLSLVWALYFKSSAKVYSIEAHPEIFKNVQESIIDNNIGDRMSVFNYAVGQTNGELEMFVRSTTANKNPSSGSAKNSVKVPMISIDSFVVKENINKIDLIKIDVDGMEFEILNGASQAIKKFMPDLVVETNKDKRILDLVKAWGYHLYDLNLSEVQGDSIPGNIVCLSRKYENNNNNTAK